MPLHDIDLPQLILDLRADLRARLGFHLPERRAAYLAWLVTSGLREYAALRTDESLLRSIAGLQTPGHGTTAWVPLLQKVIWQARRDVQTAFPLPEALPQYQDWFFRHGVGEHGLWPCMPPAVQQRLCLLEGPWQAEFLEQATQALLEGGEEGQSATPPPTPGVNLVGYVHGQLGIGEDVRMAARALQAAHVPFAMVNFPPGHDVPQNDMTLADRVVPHGPHAVNVFCLTAQEQGRFYAERGAAQWAGRYTIGYWPWELSRWPQEWAQLLHLVDEVWVSTHHTRQAVEPVCAALPRPLPVHVMPMAVELGPVARGSRAAWRQRWGLPPQARLMVFTFDLNSSIHRKNPQAVVQAFVRAFPAEQWSREQVGLVIKVHPPRRPHTAWERLKQQAAQDARLHIIEETLPRPELLALYRACDAFVSLHRAEGFGRGIAEALQLGLHVITTGYSGNVDFCSAPEFAHMVEQVRHRPIKVRKGQYPYGEGQVWANADIAHAAACMQSFVQRYPPGPAQAPPHRVPQGGWPVFSAAVVGQRYAARLAEIYGSRA